MKLKTIYKFLLFIGYMLLATVFAASPLAWGDDTKTGEAKDNTENKDSSDEDFLNKSAKEQIETENDAINSSSDKKESQSKVNETQKTVNNNDTSNKKVPKSKIRDHKYQGFVNITLGTGWFIVAPYDKNNPDKACGLPDSANGEWPAICSGHSVMHLDFLGGFGIKKGFEILMMYRQGLQPPEMGIPQIRQIGAGIKAYTPNDGLFKLGFGIVPLIDFSKRNTSALGNDFVIHVPIDVQFDFTRWIGAYLQIAPNISFISEFRIEITPGIGIQGRFP